MKIGFLGNGAVANKLAALFTKVGHEVLLGQREGQDETSRFQTGSFEQAAAYGEIVVITIPYTACPEVLSPLSETVAGKIAVDVTNPIQPDWSPVKLNTSAGEEIARLLPEAKVVKAFNTVFADMMDPNSLNVGEHQLTTFICSDHQTASKAVAELAEAAGFAPIETGSLATSAYVEAMAHLNIQLAVTMKGGTKAGFVYFKAQ